MRRNSSREARLTPACSLEQGTTPNLQITDLAAAEARDLERIEEQVGTRLLREAAAALSEARTLKESIDSLAHVEVIHTYMRRMRYASEAQRDAAELKLRAERRVGKLLSAMEKHPGGRPSKNPSHDATGSPPTLDELGFTRSAASRSVHLARVPEEEFEAHIAHSRVRERELTRDGLLRPRADGRAPAASR